MNWLIAAILGIWFTYLFDLTGFQYLVVCIGFLIVLGLDDIKGSSDYD